MPDLIFKRTFRYQPKGAPQTLTWPAGPSPQTIDAEGAEIAIMEGAAFDPANPTHGRAGFRTGAASDARSSAAAPASRRRKSKP